MTVAAAHRPQMFEPWQEIYARDLGNTFLVPGLIHSAATLLTGRPLSYKTTLSADLTVAVAGERDTFLGRPIQAHGPVMISATDPGEQRAWSQRVQPNAPKHPVHIAHHGRGSSWDDAIRDITLVQPVLYIFDNVLGNIEGSVNDNEVATPLLKRLDQIADMGVAVLLIHHSNALGGKGGMGSTVYEAWARASVHVEPSGDRTVTASARSNDCAPSKLSIDVEFEAPDSRQATLRINSDESVSDGRPRKADKHAKRRELGRRIVNDPELSAMSQREIAERLTESQTEVSRSLREVGARKVEGRWTP